MTQCRATLYCGWMGLPLGGPFGSKFVLRNLLSVTESNQLCFDLMGPSQGVLCAYGANLSRFSILR